MMWFLFTICNEAAESIQRTFSDNMELHFTHNLEMACNDSSSKKMCQDMLSRKRLPVFVDCLMLPLHLCILCAHLWWVCLLSPSPPRSVDCAELKLECIALTLHQKVKGGGKMPQFDELVCLYPKRFDQGCR